MTDPPFSCCTEPHPYPLVFQEHQQVTDTMKKKKKKKKPKDLLQGQKQFWESHLGREIQPISKELPVPWSAPAQLHQELGSLVDGLGRGKDVHQNRLLSPSQGHPSQISTHHYEGSIKTSRSGEGAIPPSIRLFHPSFPGGFLGSVPFACEQQ